MINNNRANPEYPNLGATVARLRRGDDRKAHGAAVLEAIRRLQQGTINRETPSHNVHCASGTNHNTGNAILAAVAKQNRATSLKFRSLTAGEWKEKYDEAMKEKRERDAARAAEIIQFQRKETIT